MVNGGQNVALYVRVSTDNQDEKMQLAAAEPILREIPPDRLLVFVDHGVSAAKIPMEKRPELQRMLNLIRSGQIGTVIVYERDRLARNPYEYMEIVKLLHSRKVKVIFTAVNARPFDDSLIVEGIAAIAASAEAQAIQRRVSDTVKEYPAQLYGYKRIKANDGFIHYVKDPERSDAIQRAFEDIASVSSWQEFVDRFEYHRKSLRRTEPQFLKMLHTPFYTAHVLRFETYHPLTHVEPIVSLELFEVVQQKIRNFAEAIKQTSGSMVEAIVEPICGICGEPMTLKTSIKHQPRFQCRRGGHQLNTIGVQNLNEIVKEEISCRLKNFDLEALRQTCSRFIGRHERRLAMEEARQRKSLEEKSLLFAKRFNPGDSGKAIERAIQELDELETKITKISETRRQLQAALSLNVQALIDLVQQNIATRMHDAGSVRALASLLFRQVLVFPDHIELSLYYSRFLRGGKGGGEENEATA